MNVSSIRFCLILLLAVCAGEFKLRCAGAEEPVAGDPDIGYRLLTEKAYLPPYFDQETFDYVWRVWPKELRAEAEAATAEQRRQMAFSRYGLTVRPNDPEKRPLQYVVDGRGQWTLNCFACHGGQVEGRVIPGLPNSRYAMATFTDDIRKAKVKLGKPLVSTDYSSLVIPLGTSNGTTNAVAFGVALMAQRDADLNLNKQITFPKMIHHDMDAPPWWHFKSKDYLYLDGFAPKGTRGLMQFMLVPKNGPNKFRQWESDFQHIYAYLESLEPPKYEGSINDKLAARGKLAFENHCASCHGSYGETPDYPEETIPIEEIGTDRARHDALTAVHHKHYGESWFNYYSRDKQTRNGPGGYVAPPLDGVWASAPYLHNGSVPTLWHMLYPDQRPRIWQRSETGYDHTKMGLEIESFKQLPAEARRFSEKRTFFDTTQFGKSATGHNYPDKLTEAEKRAVLEYLKTL